MIQKVLCGGRPTAKGEHEVFEGRGKKSIEHNAPRIKGWKRVRKQRGENEDGGAGWIILEACTAVCNCSPLPPFSRKQWIIYKVASYPFSPDLSDHMFAP